MSIAISGSTITFSDLTTQSSAAVSGGTFKNRIINGDFRIWQRGTSFSNPTTSNFYTADRWGVNRTGDVSGATVSSVASGLAGFQYALNLQRTAGNTSTEALALWNSNETSNTYDLAGQIVTLSFWARAGANYSGGVLTATLRSGTGVDQRVYAYTGFNDFASSTFTLTTTWTRYSLTGTVPVSATELGSYISWTPNGTAGADDSVKFAGVQLEKGGNASEFEVRAIGSELALCQRYYLKKAALAINGLALVGNAVVTNVQQDFPDTFPTMRSSPVASVSAASDFTIYVAAVTRTATNLQAANTSPSSCWWITQNNNIGQTVAVTLYASNANAFLQYNSEL